MNRLIALVASVATASSMLVVPSFATTDTNSYSQHQGDCLKLLFTDPAAHATECGGPFPVPASPSWTPTSGSGTCPQVGELTPDQMVPPLMRARSDAYVAVTSPCHCDAELTGPTGPNVLQELGIGDRVLVATLCVN